MASGKKYNRGAERGRVEVPRTPETASLKPRTAVPAEGDHAQSESVWRRMCVPSLPLLSTNPRGLSQLQGSEPWIDCICWSFVTLKGR